MMVHIIMEHLIKDLYMDRVDLYQALNYIIKDKLDIMLHKVEDFVLMIILDICIMDNGWMIYLMEKVNNNGMMALNIKVILLMDLKMGKGYSNLGLMGLCIMGILKKINFKEKDSYHCQKVLILGVLKMGKWKGKVCLNLKMEQFMMGNIEIIENMDLANIWKMVKFMKENGKMDIEMVRDF